MKDGREVRSAHRERGHCREAGVLRAACAALALLALVLHAPPGFGGEIPKKIPVTVTADKGEYNKKNNKIHIEQNVVDDVGTEPIATHWGEAFGFGALITSAGVNIQGNTIRNIGRRADGSSSDVILAGAIMVADNYASPPLVASNIIQNTSIYGIWDAAFLGPAPGARIESNSLTDSGVTGIAVEAYAGPRDGSAVSFNMVAQDARQLPGLFLIGVLGMDGCTINSNTLAGDVPLVGVALQSTSNCAVVANKDKRKTMSPASPTYFLDPLSSGNLIKAATGTAVDNGTNNTILIAKQ